jgi:starch-binding outer membrane protein, SusD/RagB family
MKIKYKILLGISMISLILIYACNKSFTNKPPQGTLSLASLSNQAGVQSLLIGAYSMLDQQGGVTVGIQFGNGPDKWVFASVVADDSYKGSTPSDQGDIVPLETWSTSTATNSYVANKWQVLYDGIQRANDVIRVMALATDVTPANHSQLTAEARTLRGYFHFEGVKMWGPNFPYVDETVSALNAGAVTNSASSLPKIEADLQFGIDSLSSKPVNKGRLNNWTAKAMLAELYMYEYKYAEAKTLLDDLLANGVNSSGVKYGWNPSGYLNNFNPDPGAKNSSETVFSVQMSVNDGSATNGNYGDVLNFPNDGSGPGGCCGFNNPSVNLANAYKTDANGLPLFDTYNADPSPVDSSFPGNLDPRIDFVIGRPGVSYLDYGHHRGALWVRDGTDGYFSPKKNVYALSQKNSLSSTETSFWGTTQIVANNVNIFRYSTLLLMAAECEVEAGDPAQALIDVNMVRDRIASNPDTWTYTNSIPSAKIVFDPKSYKYDKNQPNTVLAANYKIGLYPAGAFANKAYAMNAVRWERRLELAFEGYRFFDLQRWDKDPLFPEDMSALLNAYATMEKTRPSVFSVNKDAIFHKGVNEIYPIPQAQIDISNSGGVKNLAQNPGY